MSENNSNTPTKPPKPIAVGSFGPLTALIDAIGPTTATIRFESKLSPLTIEVINIPLKHVAAMFGWVSEQITALDGVAPNAADAPIG